jgi:hypothetical protein
MSIDSPLAVGRPGSRPAPDDAILFAVMDDMRHTLRTSWLDPALRSVASHPVFFTAAWAATKPNMTRSFAVGTGGVRAAAIEAVQAMDLRQGDLPTGSRGAATTPNGSAMDALSAAERERLIRTVHLVHTASAKVMVVLQAWTAMALRRRLPGTGQEEPPARRGIPSWQEGLGSLARPLSAEAEALVDDATAGLGLSVTPSALQAIAGWPRFLEETWRRMVPTTRTTRWAEAVAALRRHGLDVLGSLPHPMDLQWDVLSRRGLTEDRRDALVDHLAALGAAMPVNVLTAAHLWLVLGSPEPPGEA